MTESHLDRTTLPAAMQQLLGGQLTPEQVQQQLRDKEREVEAILATPNPLDQPLLPYLAASEPPPEMDPLQQQAARLLQERRALQLLRRLRDLRIEALNLYEPLPHIEPFHACRAPERVLRGSNRSGKTLAASVEFARACCGRDPHGKYPARDGRAFVVGKDGKHNSEVIYRKLFRAGAFSIIRDRLTGRWRSFRPWEPDDKGREAEAKPAPPLIPPRLVREISWENKKEQVPNVARLHTGWEIRFFSSLGKPPQGSDVDLVWFDEEIVDPEWYSEVAARGTIDRSGKFFWSATAQKGGEQLYELCMSAETQRDLETPRVVEVFAHIDRNRHFTDAQRSLFFDKLTDEQRRIRVEGEFAFTSFRVYPEFDLSIHGTDYFEIPSDWATYVVVDPGRQVCAVLVAAVPPTWLESRAGQVYLYEELYIRSASADKFAEALRGKLENRTIHAFLIDRHGSRITESGSGLTVEQQYSDALRAQGLRSTATGYNFLWGSDDVLGGIEAFRKWMMIRPCGTPRLQIMRERLPNFEYEISRYSYQRKGGLVLDKPVQRNNHLMDCARYLALYDPQWHPVPRKPARPNPILEIVRARRRKQARQDGAGHIRLGPGG